MIECRDIEFTYPGERFTLRIPEFCAKKGEAVALVGPSGCGKSTFLNLIAGNLIPSSGEIQVGEFRPAEMPVSDRQRYRLGNIGLVPQSFELLDYLTVRENIGLPYRIGKSYDEPAGLGERCQSLARRAGIEELLDDFPDRLSQGERQRAALCRGLVTEPPLVLADEPTGNLDPENQDKIVELLLEEAQRIEATVLMITHDPVLLPKFDRVVDMPELRKGEAS